MAIFIAFYVIGGVIGALINLRFLIPTAYYDLEETRYICPECGNKVFRGVIKCNQCKAELDLD